MKKKIALLLAGLMTAAMVTGCSGSGSADTTVADTKAAETAAADTTAADTKAADTTAADTTAAADGKVYKIATDTTFAPFEFENDKGEMVGIDLDLLKAIAEDQGFEYELVVAGFSAACTGMEAGEYDAVIAGMSILSLIHI